MVNKSIRDWDIDRSRESVGDYFKDIFSIEEDVKRVEVLGGLLSARDNLFEDHLSSPQFLRRIHPNKEGFLSEQIPICVTLEKLADTLLFAPIKTGKNSNEFYPILSKSTNKRRYAKEESYAENTENSKDESGVGEVDSVTKIKKIPRTFDCEHGVNFNVEILPSDIIWTVRDENLYVNNARAERSKFPYFILETLSNRQQLEHRDVTEVKIKKNIMDWNRDLKTLRELSSNKLLTNWRSDITKNMLEAKESMRGYIRFKRISNESCKIDFDKDTWFENNGEYTLVSENAIRLSDPSHVYGLLTVYREVVSRKDFAVDDDLHHLYLTLDKIVEDTQLDEIEKSALQLLKNGLKRDKMISEIFSDTGIRINKTKLHRVLKEQLPKKISNAYKSSREDWILTHKIRGKFQTCAQCGIPKTLTIKNFGFDTHEEGFVKKVCRNCEKSSKKVK